MHRFDIVEFFRGSETNSIGPYYKLFEALRDARARMYACNSMLSSKVIDANKVRFTVYRDSKPGEVCHRIGA